MHSHRIIDISITQPFSTCVRAHSSISSSSLPLLITLAGTVINATASGGSSSSAELDPNNVKQLMISAADTAFSVHVTAFSSISGTQVSQRPTDPLPCRFRTYTS